MLQWIFGESDEKNENKKNQQNKNQQNQQNIKETKNVYTYFENPTPLQEGGIINSEAYRHHTFAPSTPTPTLQQGSEFKKLQKKSRKK